MVMITGYSYFDGNRNLQYDKGESPLDLRLLGPGFTVSTNGSGRYQLASQASVLSLGFDRGGDETAIVVDLTLANKDGTLDFVNGDTLVTSLSLNVTGPVYNIVATGSEGLTLGGDGREQSITGTAQADTLYGRGGNDVLNGGAGNDRIFGGDGTDVAVYSIAHSEATFRATGQTATISGARNGTDTLTSVEIFRFTDGDFYFDTASQSLREFVDLTTGAPRVSLPTEKVDAGARVGMTGFVAEDTNDDGVISSKEYLKGVSVLLNGNGATSKADGTYAFFAPTGRQTIDFVGDLDSGPVSITSFFANPFDLDVIVSGGLNSAHVVTSGSIAVSGEVYKITGTGNSGLTLIGDFRAQEIIGTSGNDTIDGGAGADLIEGGRGNDRIVGGEGIDTAVFSGHARDYTVTLQSGALLVSHPVFGTDYLWGVEILRFDSGDYHYDAAADALIPFGADAGEPVVIAPPNEDPVVAGVQRVTTSEGQPISIKVTATDPDGDVLVYSVGDADGGVITGSAGNYIYTPNAGYTGSDGFSVTVRDGRGGEATQNVSVTILEANDPPIVASAQTVETDYQSAVTVTIGGTDPDGDALTYTPTIPVNGTVEARSGGSLIYTPNAGFFGEDSFRVVVSDGKGGTALQTVTVLVEEPNLAPTVLPSQTAVTTAGDTVSIFIEASDPDGDPLTFSAGAADDGTIDVREDGLLFYTPDAGFTGRDDFAVTVSDGKGGVSSLTVTVTVVAEGSPLAMGPALLYEIQAEEGFEGAFGGAGNVFGTEGAEHFMVQDLGDYVVFDPSTNRGGDIIEFPNAAASYIAEVDGSAVVIKDGEDTYVIPVGPRSTYLVFEDGTRTLRFDAATQEVKIGGVPVGEEASVITAAAQFITLPTFDGDASADVTLQDNASLSLDGDYSVFGTAASQEIFFQGGMVDLDASANRGGDTVRFDQPAYEYSAYLSGTTLVLFSGEDQIMIPMGVAGITLDFDGDVRLARIDPAAMEVLIGDEAITATSRGDAEPIGGGISLDVGSSAQRAMIDLEDGVSYTLVEDPNDPTFVTITGFDEDDQILIVNGDLEDYFFGTAADDPDSLRITSNDGSTVNGIIIKDVGASDGLIYDADSAMAVLGWNFITTG